MGYILPVNHQQYREYRKRVGMRRGEGLGVKPVHRTTVQNKTNSQYEEGDEILFEFDKEHTRKLNYDPLIKEVDPEIVDEHYAELTGSGLNFNENI